jgi:ATP-dependent RNA helicase DeaD
VDFFWEICCIMKNLNLSDSLRQALNDLKFEQASPIQAQAIPALLEGLDIVGQAQTGTGKTAAFAIPMLERLDMKSRFIQGLVLCPTRELALQVHAEFEKLGKYKPGFVALPIYGGQPIDRQIRKLRQQPQVIIGTPGRVLDMIRRGALRFNALQCVVLDEADEMLNMGFRRDIESILNETPNTRQTVFFSATMPKQILDLTKLYQRKALHIKVAQHDQPLVEIEQCYFQLDKTEKIMALQQLLKHYRFGLTLVFCNTKWKVDSLVKRLIKDGYKAEGLHGGKTQSQRDRIMQGFRQGHTQILVATDVAARGLDVRNVEAVFNFDLPKDTEFYTHRIGRTGRAGKTGQAFTFVENSEMSLLRELRKAPNVQLNKRELPA